MPKSNHLPKKLKSFNEVSFIKKVAGITGTDGPYTLTFLDALAVCTAKGMKMANASLLLHARSLGFELCTCGWLKEQII